MIVRSCIFFDWSQKASLSIRASSGFFDLLDLQTEIVCGNQDNVRAEELLTSTNIDGSGPCQPTLNLGGAVLDVSDEQTGDSLWSTVFWLYCLSNTVLWFVKFSVQPTWHALKPYDKRNRRTDRCSEWSTSTHRAHRYSTIHKPSTSWVSKRFFDSPKLQGWIMSKEYQVLTSNIKRQKKSKHVEAESALSFSTSQVTLAQRFLEVGTELFEAIKNYDAEALIGLQKDQIFTFLQVEAQHSKLLLHSKNILWYARRSSNMHDHQYRIQTFRSQDTFHDILFVVLRLFMSAFHRQVARIAKQLKASQLR